MLEWIGTIRGGKGTVNYKYIYLYIITIREVQAVSLWLTEDIVKLLYGNKETYLFPFQNACLDNEDRWCSIFNCLNSLTLL